ncbi:MAG TPA: HAD-IA family hydrolase [Acidimicrobiia bacterium]|nr:HAD-IA family hydrolase [Acidimicrobiia bacterium]
MNRAGAGIRGIVFDFDGLILDTEGPVFTAWREEFEAHGCPPLTIDEWSAEIGTSGGLDLVALIRERATRPFDEDAMHARRRERRDELLRAEVVRPGVHAWLDEADALGLPLAVASSSPREWVEHHLENLGLRSRFRSVACFGDGLAGKPAPDTYLAACAAIEIEPRAAIAIEDSPNGVAAAKAAGLWCVAVPHAITHGLDLSDANLRLDSLADVTLGEVISRFDANG